jgi:transcriptional regulator with XRE-family HTH domain
MTPSSAEVGQPELTVEEAVRSKRVAHGLSCRELANRSRLSSAYVSALESGRLAPSLRAFARLAVELRLSPQELAFLVRAEAERPLKHSAKPNDCHTP